MLYLIKLFFQSEPRQYAYQFGQYAYFFSKRALGMLINYMLIKKHVSLIFHISKVWKNLELSNNLSNLSNNFEIKLLFPIPRKKEQVCDPISC